MEKVKVLSFDRAELLLLEHKLTPSEVSISDHVGGLPQAFPSKELALKVGSALIEACTGVALLDIALTKGECWILRERVDVFETASSRQDAGLAIKRKLYQALLEFDTEEHIGDIPTVPYDHISAKEVKNELAKRFSKPSKNDTIGYS